MKKKILMMTVSLLCLMLVLAGCGGAEESTDAGEGESAAKTVSFGLDETVVKEDFCEMSQLYAEVLDDEAKAQGWWYYYTDTDENPAETKAWEISEEDYTTVEVLFSTKNISKEPQIFGDKITAKMIYLENDEADPVEFEGTVFQQNPGQKDQSGEVIMWSTKPAEVAADETVNVSFRFDIPKDVYEKIYKTAKGEDTGIQETCEFSFGDETTYVIDLKKTLILASEYEN